MTDELKPCPFCGKLPEVSIDSSFGWCTNEDCPNDAQMPLRYWNARPIEDTLRQRIASMECELLGVKRIVELAYENRLVIPGMLQVINNYEDALKPG